MKITFMILIISMSLHAVEVMYFKDINKAVETFVDALGQKDEKSLSSLFTEKYKTILKIQKLDNDDVKHFIGAYNISHHLVSFGSKEVYLEVGKRGWTFPIPLVNSTKGWSYNIDIGIDNIITRVIGRNELALLDALKDGLSLESLQSSENLKAYHFKKDGEYTLAIPKEYGKTAIMSFAMNAHGEIFELNSEKEVSGFNNNFVRILQK